MDNRNSTRIRDYYATPDVRARLIESLGGRRLDEATCYYIGRCFDTIKPGFCMNKPAELDLFLRNEWDVARSLWDRQWLFADVDIEYVNFDFPAEPFLDYRRCFSLQEPVRHAVERVFRGDRHAAPAYDQRARPPFRVEDSPGQSGVPESGTDWSGAAVPWNARTPRRSRRTVSRSIRRSARRLPGWGW